LRKTVDQITNRKETGKARLEMEYGFQKAPFSFGFFAVEEYMAFHQRFTD
jgi:hypothetical protein